MSFLKDIQAFEGKALLAASRSTNKITEDFLSKPVELSPTKPVANYAQGHLIAQWYSAVGPNPNTSSSSSTDMTGEASLARIKATLASNPFLGKDNIVTLTNSVSYAYRVDKLGWPAGEGDNGWHWSGRVGPYLMTSQAKNYILGKYQ